MLDKLEKLLKLWSFQEKEIRNKCRLATLALENEKVQVGALEQFHQEYMINVKDIVGLELKEKAKFCNNLGSLVQVQKKGLEKLKVELMQLQALHNQFLQKISSLEKVISKRQSIVDAHKLQKEFRQVEDLYRQFKQYE